MLVLLKMTLVGAGFSDDVSHIRLGASHGRCAREMVRGIEMSLLEDANVRSIAGCGCESFGGVHCTGLLDGD